MSPLIFIFAELEDVELYWVVVNCVYRELRIVSLPLIASFPAGIFTAAPPKFCELQALLFEDTFWYQQDVKGVGWPLAAPLRYTAPVLKLSMVTIAACAKNPENATNVKGMQDLLNIELWLLRNIVTSSRNPVSNLALEFDHGKGTPIFNQIQRKIARLKFRVVEVIHLSISATEPYLVDLESTDASHHFFLWYQECKL